MRYIKVLFFTLFFFVFMVFFFQNTHALSAMLVISLDLGILKLVSREVPFYLLVLICFALGSIFSMTFFLCEKLRQTKELKTANAKLAALEQEVTSLRNLPLEKETFPGMNREKTDDPLS